MIEGAGVTINRLREAIRRESERHSKLTLPAAPTVTREQAIQIRACVRVMFMNRLDGGVPSESEMPAFFRSVADQLSKEE